MGELESIQCGCGKLIHANVVERVERWRRKVVFLPGLGEEFDVAHGRATTTKVVKLVGYCPECRIFHSSKRKSE